MRYFTLLTNDNPTNTWCIEFGSYTRSEVNEEKVSLHDNYPYVRYTRMKIIETSDLQADIQAQVDLLNGIPSQPKSETVDI